MKCQICQRAIYREIEVAGQRIQICPQWDCMYSHYLTTQAKLLEAYKLLYQQHSQRISSQNALRNSNWAMRVALSTPTPCVTIIDDDDPQPRKFSKSDQDYVDYPSTSESVLVQDLPSLLHQETEEMSIYPKEPESKLSESKLSDSKMPESKLSESKMSESKMSESKMHESKLSESKMSESKMPESKLPDPTQYEFSYSLLPPDSEEDASDYLRFHMKYFNLRIAPKSLLESLNFIVNKLNVEDPVVMFSFKSAFDEYIKSLPYERIRAVKSLLVNWIKENRVLINTLRKDHKSILRGRQRDPMKATHFHQEKKRIIETWENVQDLEGREVERIEDIKSVLEERLRAL